MLKPMVAGHGVWLRIVPLAFFALLVSSGQTVRAQDGTETSPLPAIQMEMLVDPSRALSLADILGGAGADFEAVNGASVSLGYTTDAAWLRLSIEGEADRTVLLSLAPNFVDLLDVYVAGLKPGLGAGGLTHLAMGDQRPLPVDAVSGLDNVVPLELHTGQTTLVYIRMAATNSALTLTTELYWPGTHTVRTTASALAYGVWFGGMAVLLVIQLVFHHFDRKPYYLLLAMATLVAMLVYTGTLGLSRLFLFPTGGTGNDVFTAGMTWLGLTASTLAGASILELPRRAPWLNRAFLGIGGIGLVGVAAAMFGGNIVFSPLGTIASVGVATLGAFQGVRTANRDGAGTRLRAAAFFILWLGVLATFAQRTGVGMLPNWVSHAYAVSCLVQTILLTAALGVRLRAAETLNRDMQAEALVAAKVAEQRANDLVEDRTRELAVAKQVAEDALRAELNSQEQQVRFMEVISHQYRTPLAAVRLHVDNIGLSLPQEDAANHGRLDRVRRGIVRLVEVLEVNLTRSRLQGSSFRPTLVRASLVEIVAAAGMRGCDLLQPGILTRIAPEAEQARILADADMLGIAIINLLENAVKFSTQKSAAPVELSCVVADGQGAISVTDRGIGIPSQDLGNILDRSVRGSNATSIEGSGIGLSLVARIVSVHGGTVEIDSVIGRGTTVKILVPVLAG